MRPVCLRKPRHAMLCSVSHSITWWGNDFRVVHAVSRHLIILLATLDDTFSHRPHPCCNGAAFVFMCQTLRFHAMSFVILYSFMSSLMLSSHLFLGLPFVSFPALACLTYSWWYPPQFLHSFLKFLTTDHTISVVSF